MSIMSKQFLGLGKTKFNSSVCLLDENNSVELLLTERLNRKKNSGAWPAEALVHLKPQLNLESILMAENRDVHQPSVIEETQNKNFPFFEYLCQKNLEIFTRKFNQDIEFVPHHLSHAYAALAMSPFLKSVIIVMDGAGSETGIDEYEECTVYLQDKGQLKVGWRQIVKFEKTQNDYFGNRVGVSFEKASEYVFGSPHSSGKVMGLASFGKGEDIPGHIEFQKNLNSDKAFHGKSKAEWERCDHADFIKRAADVQKALEDDYQKVLKIVKEKFPEYDNLILTGGCALNCTNNAKIYYQKLFKNIYVLPFPGDESISFGLANYLKYKNNPDSWKPLTFDNQAAYFGAKTSIPTDEKILNCFDDSYELKKCENIEAVAAELLADKNIIAWFQGRSESGPRALGNRSILAHPDVPELKNYLNKNIKFRESFRPYGCSVLFEKASEYFLVEEGFNNPFMSYAIKVREHFKETLKEVSHIDGTSRMQTVRSGQNTRFYQLLKEFGDKTGLYCLLNTSLNVMDEPILENVEDAKRFMDRSMIDYLVIGDWVVKRKR